jgi:hypothetical protein
MSVVLRNSVELAKSPLNTSPSKNTYTFAKSKRFPDIKLPAVSPKLYPPKDVWNYRSAGIGYGKKYAIEGSSNPLTKETPHRLPTMKSKEHSILRKKLKESRLGYQGVTPKTYSINQFLHEIVPDPYTKIPGPDSYTVRETAGRRAKSISMAIKLQDFCTL